MKLTDLTVNERILLHLRDFPSDKDTASAQMGQTQEGIGEGVEVRINHIPRSAKKLLADGYVEEWLAHVGGLKRKRKVYTLTKKGRTLADKVLQQLHDEEVPVRFSDGKEMSKKIGDIPLSINSTATLSQIILMAYTNGIVVESDVGKKTKYDDVSYVSNVDEIPFPTHFLGRKEVIKELDDYITGQTVVTIISGVKGIGKTSLVRVALEKYEGERNIFWYTANEWDTARSFFEFMANMLAKMNRNSLKKLLKPGKDVDINLSFAAFQEDLEGTEAIIIIDNAFNLKKDLEHVLMMICKGCTEFEGINFIFTTRQPDLFMECTVSLPKKVIGQMVLEGLSRNEAFRFMKGMGIEESQHERIYGITNGHPLALELVNSSEVEKVIDTNGLTEEEILMLKCLKAFDVIFQ